MPVAARLLLPIALLALGAFYYVEAGTIRVLYASGPMGPQDFPRLLVMALAVGLVFVVIGDLRRAAGGTDLTLADLGVVAGVVLICAACVLVFRIVGFVPATFALALALLVAFARGNVRWLRAGIEAGAITLAVYALFALVFEVRLPPTPFLDAIGGVLT